MLRAAAAARTVCAAVILSIGLSGTLAGAGGFCRHPHGYPSAPIGGNPGPVWKPNAELVLLGQKLFFDPRLSATGATSCARCHDPRYAYAEPRRVSISDNGQPGRRNSPSLLDVGLRPTLMWDGVFCTLEQQALGPFERNEMGLGVDHAMQRVSSDPEYLHLFRLALGNWPTVEGFTRALAGYQRTLFSAESRVDRFVMNNETALLTPQEQHGFYLFTRKAGCSICHHLSAAQPDGIPGRRLLLTDFRFHNLGIGYQWGRMVDAGRYALSQVATEWGAFRTPSLRNIARTAPYMHDGSFATLEEVVEFYSAGARPNPYLSPFIRPLFLDGAEKAALVAFLRALND